MILVWKGLTFLTFLYFVFQVYIPTFFSSVRSLLNTLAYFYRKAIYCNTWYVRKLAAWCCWRCLCWRLRFGWLYCLDKEEGSKNEIFITFHTGYGLVLSGPSQVLKPHTESMIFSKKKLMDQYVKSIEEFMSLNSAIIFLIAILKITWSKQGYSFLELLRIFLWK